MPTVAEILEEEKRRQEEAREASQKPARVVPTTRQALYGDIIEEEQEVKSDIADEFGFVEEELGRREDPLARRKELETEKQRRYERATGTTEERDRLSAIDREMEEMSREFRSELEPGEEYDPFELRRQLEPLEEERRQVEAQIREKETIVTPDGTRVRIPPPESADDPLRVMGARAISELGRGLAGLFGKEAENAIPQIRDESDVVNVGSEVLQLMAGAGTGAIAASRVLGAVAKNSGPLTRTLAAIVGAPVGEALVATSETGTLTGKETDTTLDRKIRVLMEGLTFGSSLAAGAKTFKTIGEITPVARILRSIPVAFIGGREGAERAAGDTLAALISRAENAQTDEARAQALQQIQDRIAKNFEEQTGVNFNDYIEGRVDLPEGVTFRPTLGGTAELDLLAGVERGIAQKGGLPEFSGRMQEQREAVKAGIEEATVSREVAEELGTEAGEEIGGVVAGRVETAREAAVVPLQRQLDEAVEEVDEQFAPGAEITFAGLDQVRTNNQVANNAAEQATDLVESAYLAGRNQKNELYADYGADIAEIEVPANLVETSLRELTDPRRIASVSDMVASANPYYARTLDQLALNRQRLEAAISKQLDDKFEELVKDIDPKDLTPQQIQAYRDQARTMIDIDAAKEAADYRDVSLQDIEGLLQTINAVKNRTQDVAQQGAMTRIADGLEDLIQGALADTPEIIAKRNEAIEFFQGFNDLYRTATGGKFIPNFRFGEKITDQQFTQAQDGLIDVLNNAKSDNAPLQFIQDLRATMDEDTLNRFDDSLRTFYKHDIYSNVRIDPNTQAARDNPQEAARRMAASLKKSLTQNTNLEQLAPGVVEDITQLANRLDEAAGNVVESRRALDEATKQFEEAKKIIEATPEAQFATQTRKGSARKAVKRLIMDEDSVKQFPEIWRTAGEAGPKGADGLTDAQRKLKATIAQGTMDLVYTAGARGKETGELTFANIERAINENPVFNTAFPEGDATREMFDTIIAQTRAMSKRTIRATEAESPTAAISNVGQLVSELINYVEGPLSKEGRRSKMLSRVFFKLAGGPDKAAQVMTEVFLDVRLANRLLEEAKQRMRATAEPLDVAKNYVVGAYILQRLGVRSLEEFNSEVESVVLEQETEDAFKE
jgi:hypothetical protein